MITHFINNTLASGGQNVTFEYGYYFRSANQWKWKSLGVGNVDTADYDPPNSDAQNGLTVISVRETNTMPAWQLGAGSGAPLLVSDLQLIYLKLHILFNVPSGGRLVQKMVTLDFNATSTNVVTSPPTGNVVQKFTEYRMRWQNSDFSNTPPQQYCHGSSKQPDDMVVFQQGIDVDPLSGMVKRPKPGLKPNPADVVTVSCSLGAPAVVYSWGYPYQGLDTDPDTFYFDAGIHMKRASYCGDSRYYTMAGTTIHISDSKVVHDDMPNPDVEAWWNRGGAVCVNSERMRHPEMAPTDPKLMSCNGIPGIPYNGQPQQLPNCSFICNGKPLLPCQPSPPLQPRLIDEGP